MKENSSLKKEDELKLLKRPQADLNINTNSARAEGNNNLTLRVRPVETYQTAWFSVKGKKTLRNSGPAKKEPENVKSATSFTPETAKLEETKSAVNAPN